LVDHLTVPVSVLTSGHVSKGMQKFYILMGVGPEHGKGSIRVVHTGQINRETYTTYLDALYLCGVPVSAMPVETVSVVENLYKSASLIILHEDRDQ